MNPTHQSADAGRRPPEETPTNGIRGLKHWRHDLVAGIVVSLVSLPLSCGIAIASGAPPIYGLISAIIAGLVYPALGGSYVTISGPAAGLAPALAAIMVTMGGVGDAHTVGAGYHRLLVVIFFVGLLQILVARTGLAKFAAIFPAAVVEGMLAAIGVLIFVKALPLFFGVVEPGKPHGFLDYLGHIPTWWEGRTDQALAIGAVTLAVMLLAASSKGQKLRAFRLVPPHLWGVLVAVPMGLLLGLRSIDPNLLITVPANPLDGVGLPAFSEVFGDSSLWWPATVGLVTLLLIDGVESLATAQAVDRIDPFKRTSEPDRVLQAMGVSNMLSSFVGGLTVIPGGVKSKTNIEAGGRTLWSNFVNAGMLLIFLFVAPGLISLIPTAALGAILVYTGWRMAHPSIAKHMAAIGSEQLALYVGTIVVTVLTDLLIGVLVGTVAKLLILSFYAARESRVVGGRLTTWAIVSGMFRDPVKERRQSDGVLTLDIDGPLVCFNAFHLRDHVRDLSSEVSKVIVNVTGQAAIIDHTACDTVYAVERLIGGREFVVLGLSEMLSMGETNDSLRLQQEHRFRDAVLDRLYAARPIHKVVCAVDLTVSNHAATAGACIADQLGGLPVVFVYVTEPRNISTSDGLVTEAAEDVRSRMQGRLEQFRGAVFTDRPGCRLVIRTGDPVAEILTLVRDEGADLLVLGTASKEGIRRMMLGSVAEKLVRRSHVPTLVVPELARASARLEPVVAEVADKEPEVPLGLDLT